MGDAERADEVLAMLRAKVMPEQEVSLARVSVAQDDTDKRGDSDER